MKKGYSLHAADQSIRSVTFNLKNYSGVRCVTVGDSALRRPICFNLGLIVLSDHWDKAHYYFSSEDFNVTPGTDTHCLIEDLSGIEINIYRVKKRDWDASKLWYTGPKSYIAHLQQKARDRHGNYELLEEGLYRNTARPKRFTNIKQILSLLGEPYLTPKERWIEYEDKEKDFVDKVGSPKKRFDGRIGYLKMMKELRAAE